MGHGPRYRVARRRRREGKTDYRRRIKLLKSREARAVVRRSERNLRIQFVLFDPKGDKTIATAQGLELEKFGWKGSVSNTPAAYLTGYLAGKRAIAAGLKAAVLDIGLHTPTKGSRVFASLKGMLDAGVDIPHSEEVLPSEERIRGEHIDEKLKVQFDSTKASLEEEK
ncbi:MAG: 50S ribosomal protein L18 [Thermoplasmata archaeon]|nr:MAG: 50S ribosomal protein L18 [Thermoplasmata archaeon]